MTEFFNPYKSFVGSFIPNCLMECTEISSTAKLAYARLAQYAGEDGEAYPAQKTLAVKIGVSERQINRVLEDLEEKGFIKRIPPVGKEKIAHKSTRYKFVLHNTLKPHIIGTQKCISNTDANDSSQRTDVDGRRRESVKENHIKNRLTVDDFLKEKTYRYPEWLLQKKAEVNDRTLTIYFYNQDSIEKCAPFREPLEADAGMPVTFKESS